MGKSVSKTHARIIEAQLEQSPQRLTLDPEKIPRKAGSPSSPLRLIGDSEDSEETGLCGSAARRPRWACEIDFQYEVVPLPRKTGVIDSGVGPLTGVAALKDSAR